MGKRGPKPGVKYDTLGRISGSPAGSAPRRRALPVTTERELRIAQRVNDKIDDLLGDMEAADVYPWTLITERERCIYGRGLVLLQESLIEGIRRYEETPGEVLEEL